MYSAPVDGLGCVLLYELCRQSAARTPGDQPPVLTSRPGETDHISGGQRKRDMIAIGALSHDDLTWGWRRPKLRI